MREKTIIFKSANGLHLRPAAEVTDHAAKFNSEIIISKNGKTANAKSMVNVISLEIGPGEQFTISANGDDEEEAIAQLERLISEWEDEA